MRKKREDTKDDDPNNMLLRAGYLIGLSQKQHLDAGDREMLQRASRSLQYAARVLAPGSLKNETALRAALADFMSDWCIAPGTEGQLRLAGDEPCESDVDELISIFRNRG